MSHIFINREEAGRDNGKAYLSRHFTLDGTGGGGITSERLSPVVPPSVPRILPSGCAPHSNAIFLNSRIIIPARIAAAVVLCGVFDLCRAPHWSQKTLSEPKPLEWINRATSSLPTLRGRGNRDIPVDFEHIATPFGDKSGYGGMLRYSQDEGVA